MIAGLIQTFIFNIDVFLFIIDIMITVKIQWCLVIWEFSLDLVSKKKRERNECMAHTLSRIKHFRRHRVTPHKSLCAYLFRILPKSPDDPIGEVREEPESRKNAGPNYLDCRRTVRAYR